MLKEALLYEKIGNNKVQCHLCAHQCRIASGHFGICGVRQNSEGILYSLSYGQVIAAHVDPIEKKPLFHFLPRSSSYSIATPGCNFTCRFCQNWQISQEREGVPLSYKDEYQPKNVVEAAIKNECKSISYTYTEPTVFFEYALDVAKEAKERDLYNVFVTNGFMSKEAVLMVKPYLDAANVDLKSFSDNFYKKVCGGRLAPVLENIRLMHKLGIWVEITTLLVPGLNDSEDELKSIAGFISGIDKGIPWHISRFHPDYKMTDKDPTKAQVLDLAKKIGKGAGLRYVYNGNLMQEENTICYKCKKTIIRRLMFDVIENNTRDNKCLYCNSIVEGVKLDGFH